MKLPGTPGDEWEDDFLLLSDVFPTGYHATELARVTTGKTVAIFGAGPVGLLSAYSSILKGASEVYVVDNIAERLEKAEELGATPVDFSKGDPVEQISNSEKRTRGFRRATDPEKKNWRELIARSTPWDIKREMTSIRKQRNQPKCWKMSFGW